MFFIIGVWFWFAISIDANGMKILIPNNLYSIILDLCVIFIVFSPFIISRLIDNEDEDKDDEDNERG